MEAPTKDTNDYKNTRMWVLCRETLISGSGGGIRDKRRRDRTIIKA